MSTPLGEVRSREVFDLPDGETHKIRFGGVRVQELSTGQQVFLTGPVDMRLYGTIMHGGVNTTTGQPWENDGISLLVTEEDGQVVEKFWNLVAKKAITNLRGDLESGSYLRTLYEVTGSGPAPKTTYQFRRIPNP
jgi:hypothetical protein